MNNMKKVFLIASYNVKKWIINPRIYVIVFLLYFYTNFMLAPIKTFSENVAINVTPFLFPFFMTSEYSCKIIFLGVVLLFCDAPFIDCEHPYIILRSGRGRWYIGQFLYICIASAIYTLLLIAMTLLVIAPNISFTTDWGKVINTFAQTGIAFQHGVVVPFDYSIIVNYSPITAMLLQFLLCWLIFVMFGNLIFIFNVVINRAAGSIIAVSIILFQFVAEAISPKITFFSPASWVSLSLLELKGPGNYPTIKYVFIVTTVVIIISAFLSFEIMKKRDIEILKNI